MNRDQVEQIVDEVLETMRLNLHLGDWHIRVDFGTCRSEPFVAGGECHADPAYQSAHITLDPDQLETQEDVLTVLRHELLHVVCAEWTAARAVARTALEASAAGAAAIEAVDKAFAYADERQVRALELLLQVGLGVDVNQLAYEDLQS